MEQSKTELGAFGLMLSNLAFVKFIWHLPLLIIKQLALPIVSQPFLLCL